MRRAHLWRWGVPGAILIALGTFAVYLGVTEREATFWMPGIALLIVGGALVGAIFAYDP